MTFNFQTLRWLILLIVLAASVGSVKAAQQTFKDDAGRVIYTIDDDGTVSMYEKSPGDQTISVKQGTRDEMLPQVTDVTPNKVTAGNFVILNVEGKNLVGAKVKFSLAGIEVNPYMAKPDSLALPIRVPASAPAVDVILEITTPIGGTQASFKVAGLEFGGTSSARSEKQVFTTSAPSSCPEGMVGVGYELGGFCIDIDRTVLGDFGKVERACGTAGRRLCQAAEWQQACEQSKAGKLLLKNIMGDWEWTGSWESTDSPVESTPIVSSILHGKPDCQAKQSVPSGRGESFPGRCCK
ncbi:MAG TPA: hypothetical protein VGJ57_04220 [Nitrospirales bacterium]|jgi:hypothetical protein